MKKIVIIGGGIAGLSAGSYLQHNGFDTHIFEQAPCTGGVSVAWKRGDDLFDGATNWFPGSSPALNFHAYMAELLDFSALEFIDYEEFARIELENGRAMTVYKNAEKLRREMLAIAPEDSALINEVADAIEQVARLPLPIGKAFELYTLRDYLHVARHHLPLLFFARKWKKKTVAEFVNGFTNPDLRALFSLILPHHDFFSVLSVITSLGWMNMGSTGYPLGGSCTVIDAFNARYRSLGGRVTCNTPVDRIIVEAGQVRGVVLKNGETIVADGVCAAMDTFTTFNHLLRGVPLPRATTRPFSHHRTFPAMLQLSIGTGQDYTGSPNKTILQLDPPLTIGDDNCIDSCIVRFCNFDPVFAPAGKSSLIVHVRTDRFDFWSDLYKNDKKGYRRAKERATDTIIALLEKRIGLDREKIEVVDLATPATYTRYTGIYRGSYQGWAPTPAVIGKSFPKTIAGVKNLYLCGQWVEPPGGIPRSFFSGRNVSQIICKDFRRPFIAPAPRKDHG